MSRDSEVTDSQFELLSPRSRYELLVGQVGDSCFSADQPSSPNVDFLDEYIENLTKDPLTEPCDSGSDDEFDYQDQSCSDDGQLSQDDLEEDDDEEDDGREEEEDDDDEQEEDDEDDNGEDDNGEDDNGEDDNGEDDNGEDDEEEEEEEEEDGNEEEDEDDEPSRLSCNRKKRKE